MKFKVIAIANIDRNKIRCIGKIEARRNTWAQVYITWIFWRGDRLIATRGENIYYSENINNNEESLINRIVARIKNYRVGRERIFEKVTVDSLTSQ